MKRFNVSAFAALPYFISALFFFGMLANEMRAADQQCGNVSSTLTPPYIPTTGTFRVLIVFVNSRTTFLMGLKIALPIKPMVGQVAPMPFPLGQREQHSFTPRRPRNIRRVVSVTFMI